jgi:hypothetical protein
MFLVLGAGANSVNDDALCLCCLANDWAIVLCS